MKQLKVTRWDYNSCKDVTYEVPDDSVLYRIANKSIFSNKDLTSRTYLLISSVEFDIDLAMPCKIENKYYYVIAPIYISKNLKYQYAL